MDNAHVEKAYARWAPVYDLTFEAVMRPGRKAAAAAVAAACRPGARVLDVGVGTGLELPMFDPSIRLVGIDLSLPMLARAARRRREAGLDNVEGLLAMDALQLAFPDGCFDAVVAPYVLTVVPDPAASLDEWRRVLKHGGEIVLVNHVGATSGIVARAEAWLGKRSAALGWRPQFPWSVIDDWLRSCPDMQLVERRLLSPLGLFTLARLRRGATVS